MRLLELKEAVSSRVFHYTRVTTAVKIVDTGEFQLTSSLGTDWEAQYSPQGYPYYLSTTRTRHGGYHNYLGQDAVLFELDGDFYNQRYPGRAVDYWGNRNPTQDHHRAHEAEDRIFSKTASIPAKIVAIDLYVSPEADENIRARARRLIISAKRQGIALNFFTDQTAWRQRDPRNTANVNILKGQDDSRGYVGRHRGYLLPWLELVQAKKKSQLSKKASDIRYDLQYTYDKASLAQRLSVDLSNARKPGLDPDRANAVKIIQYMQANKLKTVQDFVDHLADKWKNITEEDHSDDDLNENFADGKKPGRKGLARRMGVPTNASVKTLRKIAKNSSGERQRMAHWLANMKGGRQ
jgi:hypothetical protein